MVEGTKIQPVMKQPGDLHDKKGVPIYPGDLLKTFHFIGSRGKKYYLYHVACYQDNMMVAVPTCHLEQTKVSGGGKYRMSQDLLLHTEVISGCGPGAILGYEERKKVR